MDTGPTNHNIENRLRAYVARRRHEAGARFVMPPDTRHFLQTEVDRKYRSKEPRAMRPTTLFAWLGLKPVWMTATAVVAIGLVAFLVRLSWEPHRMHDLAKAEQKVRPPQSAPAPASAAQTLSAPATTSVGAPPVETARLAESNQDTLATPRQSVAASALDRKVAGLSQRFVQTQSGQVQADQSQLSQQTRNVLEDFQIELANGKLRVLDSDGSVYEAAVAAVDHTVAESSSQIAHRSAAQPSPQTAGAPPAETASAPTAARFGARARMQAEKGLASQTSVAPDTLFSNAIPFVALGTNRTLNQSVAIHGRIVLPQEHGQQIKRQSDLIASDPATLKALLQNATVQGRVVIDASNQFELNATPR
ncbi:MAG TPA: hypothetical protein PLW35_04400 [Verrucomicrobiota bacterium]|nr:hypothetical protein [Verrucomicrobiota bacterium]